MKNQDINNESAPSIDVNSRVVELDEPVKRGDSQITSVTVRKPGAGELRGVSLAALGELDVIALHKVLPRITSPMLTLQDIERMSPADLMALGTAAASFLLKTSQRREAFQS